ncbi:MogA/MoaB family molybdenum cofactor biosynthesis protein [Bacillus carboniphilus]|uniref:MogA/MoaB family molybdenum cofactor biosynthesis protein n=1 Tax=Bacillus carboniphilus TaxID=86663 RepID=A0ABP3FU03_9BACI
MWRVAIVTISDKGSKGERKDESGPLLAQLAKEIRGDIVSTLIIPDDFNQIEESLISLADHSKCDLILTTGGTGLAERDITPEATKTVIEREVPGIPEAMRMVAFPRTNFSILSRAVAGIRGKTLIINFPGSTKAVKECFSIIKPILPHSLDLLRGKTKH